jgi:hypothetical protein
VTADNRDDHRDGGNDHLDDNDNDSDDRHSLHDIFPPTEEDGDSTDTDIKFESGLDKRISENEFTGLERSKVGDS